MQARSLFWLLILPLLASLTLVGLSSCIPNMGTSKLNLFLSPLCLFLLPSLIVYPSIMSGYHYLNWKKITRLSLGFILLKGIPLAIALLSLILSSSLVFSLLSQFIIDNTALSDYISSVDSVSTYISDLITSQQLDYTSSVVALCVLPAICEEIYFRAALQKTILDTLGTERAVEAIGITSLVFALVHFSAVGLLSRLMIGSILGYTYHKTSSLPLVTILHAANNLFALLLLYTDKL